MNKLIRTKILDWFNWKGNGNMELSKNIECYPDCKGYNGGHLPIHYKQGCFGGNILTRVLISYVDPTVNNTIERTDCTINQEKGTNILSINNKEAIPFPMNYKNIFGDRQLVELFFNWCIFMTDVKNPIKENYCIGELLSNRLNQSIPVVIYKTFINDNTFIFHIKRRRKRMV